MPDPDFAAWFRSLTDIQQERVLAFTREVAQAILAEHAKQAMAQPPAKNVFSAN